MRTLLFSMLLACGEKTEDSGQTANNGQADDLPEDPKWFEEGTYYCVDPCLDTFVTFTETGSISNFVFSWWVDIDEKREMNGECFVGEAINPDETMWEVSCSSDEIELKDVVLYSEGFRLDLTWMENDYRFE